MKSPLAPFPGSPPALGPYSLAVAASGKFLFVSGMTPYDPATGKIGSGSISQQTQLVLENVSVLAAGGASLGDVVSCRVYLSSLTPESFKEMNEVYLRYFGSRSLRGRPSARSSWALMSRLNASPCSTKLRSSAGQCPHSSSG